jgi:polysaccharide pyruvyl transferase WcaK-like protein
MTALRVVVVDEEPQETPEEPVVQPTGVVELLHKVERKVYDHEVFMSFVTDDAAIDFTIWWGMFGKDLFLKWLAENGDQT